MTPWGIRKRIKGLVGGGGGSGPERDEQFDVTILLPNGQEHRVKAEPRYTLVMASQTLETPIATGCPDGGCGGCTVEVLDPAGIAQPSAAETTLLNEKWKDKPNYRLACHARVVSGGASIKALSVWSMETTRGT